MRLFALALLAATPALAGSVSLEWAPVAELDGCVEPCGYRVFYRTPDAEFTAERSRDFPASTTSVTIDTLPDDVARLWFAVKAFNEAGESEEFSNQVVKDFLPPSAPTMMQRGTTVLSWACAGEACEIEQINTMVGQRVEVPE